MHMTRKLTAIALGTAAAGVLALPASTASAATALPGGGGDHHPGHHWSHHWSHSEVTWWTVVRADDEDGKVVTNLRKGQWAKVTAVRGFTDCNTEDDSDACRFGANGADAKAPADWLAPGLRQFSLVGVVGDGDPVQLGSQRTKLTGTGDVTLAYNDLLGAYDDNRGGFLVKITKCRWGC